MQVSNSIRSGREKWKALSAVRLWQMDQKDANFKVLTWLKTHNSGCVDVKSNAGWFPGRQVRAGGIAKPNKRLRLPRDINDCCCITTSCTLEKKGENSFLDSHKHHSADRKERVLKDRGEDKFPVVIIASPRRKKKTEMSEIVAGSPCN